MSDAVPIIYSPRFEANRLPLLWRGVALGVALGCLGVLITAGMVRPSPSGVGTHQGLGMYACNFLERTGIPCGSCGMTTSFAWFARGNLLASLYIQPMGLALAMLCAMSVWAGLYIAITGRPVLRLLNLVPARYCLGPLLGLFVLAWVWKIYIHLHGMDGWG